MNKNEAIQAFVLNAYLETFRAVFVADLMKEFNTSATAVRNALGYEDFLFDQDTRWSGTNYAGKYVLAPCVEPTKTYLAKLLKAKNAKTD
jgi:hypothetical protein